MDVCDEEKSTERTVAEINETLNCAKLKETDMFPTSQIIHFAEESFNGNYRFLELNQDLSKCLDEGTSLFIKGSRNESAVMCTDTQTYDLHCAETSNSLLLVENLKFADQLLIDDERRVSKVEIKGIFHDYLEAIISKPHLGKLNELLSKTVYKGLECEYEINQEDLYEFEQLLNVVQASRVELLDALKVKQAVTIDQKIRLLDIAYHFRVLSFMLKLIDENSWNLDEVDYDETMNTLSDLVPVEVLNSLFNIYADESKIIDGVQLYQYNEFKVCRFFAEVLLSNASRFNFNEFMEAWSESVPEGMKPNEEMLHGIAVVDRKCHPHAVREFLEEKLPENIMERFNILFDVKEKWSVPEISPYIKPLCTVKMDVNALLAKYARASTVNGVKYYSSKHGK